MNDKKFEAVLILIIPQIVQLLCTEFSWDEMTATKNFYESEVYELLEQENTKLWHLSPLSLFYMYKEELESGQFTLPEEV